MPSGVLGFAVVGWAAASTLDTLGSLQILTLALVTIWGGRLGIYLLKRHLSEGEDLRYVRMINGREGFSRHLFTLFVVFTLQGSLMLVISLPVITILAQPSQELDAFAYAGVALWAIGVFFEWVGDWQLARFKADPTNEGKVLDTGLWAWTRHPNYFGDACIWWGVWLIGHNMIAIIGPLVMTFLLMKWSGVPMLEASLKKRRPGYMDYIERTSSFFPRPPKSQAA